MGQHPVRFRPGEVVSPGMYRNVDTGNVRFFDGQTPLPGSTNSASWQQVSDHIHPHASDSPQTRGHHQHPVRFPPGTVVSPGMYRNVDSGHVQFFDGQTPLPGRVNAPSWQQVSDHYHPEHDPEQAGG